MSNDVYKVTKIEDNGYDLDEKRLLNSLVLKYINPFVSIPFVCKDCNNEKTDGLCKRAKINYKDNNFYDYAGNLITKDVMLDIISNDLCSSAKVFLESDEDKLYHANMVKCILEKNILSKLKKNEENVLTVQDLMAKLYEVKEEKGSRSK